MKNLKTARAKRGYSQQKLAALMGVSRSTVAMWETGSSQPDNDSLIHLSQLLGTSADYLLGINENQPAAAGDELNDRDRRDIKHDLEKIMSDLDQQGTLMFDGDPATPEARESIRSAIAVGLEMAKKMNKQTYTPKKYRKGEDDK